MGRGIAQSQNVIRREPQKLETLAYLPRAV
jgi:hypothetical protein